ncbi:MAG: Methyltransferase domain protein [Methanoregula sp. PtaU1.Bin051]|nr:MAG: Methyltransferase domain protein [Methanoregula sp. PtaU1.Bin051]
MFSLMECITFDRYIEAFRVLERYSEEYPYMLGHLLEISARYLPDGFSMLDIGAGTGHFARSFLERCQRPVQSYTAIEPSPDHVAKIQENFRSLPVQREIINDFFTPQMTFSEKFDLIILSHCTYCFLPDPEPYLLHALSLLSGTGRVVIYQGSPANFCYFLNCILQDILPKKRVTDPTFTSWDVRNILERNRIPHSVSYLPGFLRAGEIFRPENTSLLHELITFSLMVESESMEPGILKRTEEILREIAYPSAEGPLLNLGVDAITVGPLKR